MGQRGSVEGLTRFLMRHPCSGESAQFVVDQWQQLLGSVRVALLNGRQDAGDFVHRSPGPLEGWCFPSIVAVF